RPGSAGHPPDFSCIFDNGGAGGRAGARDSGERPRATTGPRDHRRARGGVGYRARVPEGDTVYRTAHQQRDALAGRVLRASDFRVPAFATVDLAGETVHDVVSRGKHLLHRIGDWTVHSHLKMEGAWRVFRGGE